MDEQLIQLHVEDPNEAVMLLGISDQNMKLIEEAVEHFNFDQRRNDFAQW